MSIVIVLAVLAFALVLGIGFAFLPMRLLLSHIAANIQQFIVRERERRAGGRETPERRKPSEIRAEL